MIYDKTFISIRERSALELFDLSLQVIREHFRELTFLLAVGVLPWLLIDCWLLREHLLAVDEEQVTLVFWLAGCLVASQAQVGTKLMTVYLGMAMFAGKPRMSAVFASLRSRIGGLIWTHGFIRMVLPIIFICWFLHEADSAIFALISGFALPVLVGIALLVRALRPFASEIVLLERTPFRPSSKDGSNSREITYRRRSASLHSHAGSELFGRFVVTCIFCLPLALTFQSLFVYGDEILNLTAGTDRTLATIYWMISFWLVAGIVSVARFLSYIDVRTRQEGWAVDLKMRSEGYKLRKRFEPDVLAMVLVLVGSFAFTANSLGQEIPQTGDEALARQTLPWYDSDTGEIKPVELPDREAAASTDRNSVSNRIHRPKTPAGPTVNFSWDWLQGLTWVGVAVMIALVIAALVWAFLNVSLNSEPQEAPSVLRRSRSESVQQLPFSVDTTDDDFRSLARRAWQSGDFRQAIIWLFSHVLVTLDQSHLIRLKKGKTNRQYLQELGQNESLANYYQQVMLPFESTFFGDHPMPADQFQTCWDQLDAFQSEVDSVRRGVLQS